MYISMVNVHFSFIISTNSHLYNKKHVRPIPPSRLTHTCPIFNMLEESFTHENGYNVGRTPARRFLWTLQHVSVHVKGLLLYRFLSPQSLFPSIPSFTYITPRIHHSHLNSNYLPRLALEPFIYGKLVQQRHSK